MPTSTSFITILFCMITGSVFAQRFSVTEKTPVVENGFEYGFTIKNEQVKEVKGEDYSRYEISFYVTNKSGCTKLYNERSYLAGSSDKDVLAQFNCLNATGKRFTSKNAKVRVREFYVTVKRKDSNNKEVFESVKAGYRFRNNDTIYDNIIVIVPKGEQPTIECVLNNLPELQ